MLPHSPAVRLSVGLNDANFQKAAEPASDPSKHVVRLNFRFTLSLRDVEKMLAQRGIEVSYETIRCAVNALPSSDEIGLIRTDTNPGTVVCQQALCKWRKFAATPPCPCR